MTQTTWISRHRLKTLAGIALLFIVTRLWLVGVGTWALENVESNEIEGGLSLLDGGPALDMWYRWDAGFYTSIATFGYKWHTEQRIDADVAFLPVYPALIKTGMSLSGCGFSPYLSTCATVSGLIVANIALFIAVCLLFVIAQKHAGRRAAWLAVALFCVSPVSVYFSGVYTEAVFILLCLLTFWLLDRERFYLAVVVAALACLTRSVGLALIPVLLFHAWRAEAGRAPRLLAALLPGAAFGAYILLAGLWIGDLFAYFTAYRDQWAREAGNVWDAFSVYWSGVDVSLVGWPPSWVDLIATLGGLGFALALFRIRTDWALFALFAVLIPINSGTLVAMPRYVLVIFPFYIVLAAALSRWWQMALLYPAALGLMSLITVRFVTWRWFA